MLIQPIFRPSPSSHDRNDILVDQVFQKHGGLRFAKGDGSGDLAYGSGQDFAQDLVNGGLVFCQVQIAHYRQDNVD